MITKKIKKLNFFQKTLLLGISVVTFILYNCVIIWRIFSGKEILNRVLERFGISKIYPKKNKDYIWIHAASVGEMLVAINLCKILNKNFVNNAVFLITTGTRSSSELFDKKFAELNFEIIHQFFPMDNYFIINLFIKKWRPKLCIVIESEIWPNFVLVTSRYMPMILANARMSERSFRRWRRFALLIKPILESFVKILAQSDIDYKYFAKLSKDNVVNMGNLKYASDINIDDSLNLKIEKDKNLNYLRTKGKKIILASSTHEGEEEIFARIYRKLKKNFNDIFLLIIPRHIERRETILTKLDKIGNFKIALRSRGEDLTDDTDIYIADTYGEMNLFLSLKPITIMGGSFTWYGHNIIEPAKFGCLIIFGPNMQSFKDIANEFIAKKAALQVATEEELYSKLEWILQQQNKIIDEFQQNSLFIVEEKQNIADNYAKFILEFLKN